MKNANEKLDVAFSKLKTELILWIVGTVGLGVASITSGVRCLWR
jgi:hypothetical protein